MRTGSAPARMTHSSPLAERRSPMDESSTRIPRESLGRGLQSPLISTSVGAPAIEAIEATSSSVAGSLPSQDVHVAHESAKRNPLNDWSEDEVEKWLKVKYPKIARAAKAAGVNGRVLQELDALAWTELGVTVALRRSQLVAAVKQAAEGRDVATIPFEDIAPSRTPSSTSAAAKGERHLIQIRCAIQNLSPHDFAKSQTFEALIKFEASWEDRSPILYKLDDAGYKLGDRIVKEKEKCTYNKFVILQHDGSEYSELFTPRITFKNRAKEPKTKEELYVAELPQNDSDSH